MVQVAFLLYFPIILSFYTSLYFLLFHPFPDIRTSFLCDQILSSIIYIIHSLYIRTCPFFYIKSILCIHPYAFFSIMHSALSVPILSFLSFIPCIRPYPFFYIIHSPLSVPILSFLSFIPCIRPYSFFSIIHPLYLSLSFLL